MLCHLARKWIAKSLSMCVQQLPGAEAAESLCSLALVAMTLKAAENRVENSRSVLREISHVYLAILDAVVLNWAKLEAEAQRVALMFFNSFAVRQGKGEIDEHRDDKSEEAQLAVNTVFRVADKGEWVLRLVRELLQGSDADSEEKLRWSLGLLNLLLRCHVGRTRHFGKVRQSIPAALLEFANDSTIRSRLEANLAQSAQSEELIKEALCTCVNLSQLFADRIRWGDILRKLAGTNMATTGSLQEHPMECFGSSDDLFERSKGTDLKSENGIAFRLLAICAVWLTADEPGRLQLAFRELQEQGRQLASREARERQSFRSLRTASRSGPPTTEEPEAPPAANLWTGGGQCLGGSAGPSPERRESRLLQPQPAPQPPAGLKPQASLDKVTRIANWLAANNYQAAIRLLQKILADACKKLQAEELPKPLDTQSLRFCADVNGTNCTLRSKAGSLKERLLCEL